MGGAGTPARTAAVAEPYPPTRYPALPAQQGLIVNSLRYPGDGVDVIQATLDWAEPLRPEPFGAAWRDVVRRHPVLRTGFRLTGEDGMVQVVDPDASIEIRWRTLPPPPPDGPDHAFESFLRTDRRERFDVTRAPLIRMTVLRRASPTDPPGHDEPVYRAVLTFHHALLDGRSLRLVLDEVSELYAAHRDGRVADLPSPPPFHDVVRWWYAADLSASQRFWTGYLAGIPLPRPLPGYLAGYGTGPAESSTCQTVLSRHDSDRIRDTARSVGLSASTMVLAAWALLRARYGGVSELAVAVTRACRYGSIPDAEHVIGPVINTVPLRVRIDPGWSVPELLSAVNEGLHRIREHQLAPMGSILRWSGLPTDTTLLDSLVMFERRRVQTGLRGPAAPVDVRLDRLPSYPLTVCAFDEPEIHLAVVGDRHRFVAGSAERILDQLRATLAELGAAARPDRATPLALLDMGAAAEAPLRARWGNGAAAAAALRARSGNGAAAAAALRARWGDGAAGGYPRDATLPALFAAQVARRPDAAALVFDDEVWTYAELDRRTNAAAWALRRRGVGTDTPVAVAMPRGAGTVAMLLAIVKAGGAYLPIDPASPPAHAAALIRGAGARLVLVSERTEGVVPALPGVELMRVDDAVPPAAGDDEPPPDLAHPLSLAYLSFTSGSTGVPKGVAVPHRAVVRLISDPTFVTLGPGQRVLHLAPVAFDASTLEIWGALLTGATVVVAPPGPLGLPEIASLLRHAGVTVAWLTAGLFHQLVEADVAALAGVQWLLAGGDVLNPDAVRAALTARGGRPVVNGYGPTENTTFTACHVLTDPAQVGPAVPIGRPIQHTTVQVLDPQRGPSAVGVPGELYTGGDGLARGYAGNPAATARAFVPDPDGHGARRYRTGDLARWRADGTLEFLGRVDDQVKIRGFRVEPREVEAALRAHPGIREAVVVVRGEGSDRHLVGYVTPVDGSDARTLRPGPLRDFVAERLPPYLVPAGFAVVDAFPLNANGKVDRGALPAPERRGPEESAPPRGPTEQRLADVWRALLPADTPGGPAAARIGRYDSFFALGGNSLSAARLMFRLREVFGIDLPMSGFYEAPTLAACAAAIDAAAADAVGADVVGADVAGADVAGADAVGIGADGRAAVARALAPAPIGRRSREAYRVTRPAPDGAVGSGAGPARAIVRRDRSAYRAGAAGVGGGAPHLVPLAAGWDLWRTVCLRAAGFPVELLGALGDPRLATAADAHAGAADGNAGAAAGAADGNAGAAAGAAAYAAEFDAAVRRLSAALYDAARTPALREAVAWQNRHALATGVDALLRRGPQPDTRNTKHRQHEALVASYLQRYCAKNDTIGFFGPVSWLEMDDGDGIRIVHAPAGPPVSARVTYLEGWAVRAIMADHVEALRPWLVPRRMPFLDLDGGQLRLPLAPPVPLTPAEVAVLRACDGVRDATEVAALVLADPDSGLADRAEVFAIMGRLSDANRLAWRLDVAPQDIRPERSVRAILSRVPDLGARAPAEAALDELVTARDALAAAAGDAGRVAAAMADLETTFTRLAGVPPVRRAGSAYAGRTLAYEECLRADTVELGAGALDGLRSALALVLDSARWFTAACGARYAAHFTDVYRQRAAALGSPAVPFADFWLLAHEALFGQPHPLAVPAVRALQQRWEAILGLPTDARRVELRAADLREAVAAAFPPQPRVWPMAAHHSVDLMIAGADAAAGGPYRWVLGEIHPSVVTTRYATWLELHRDPDALRAAMRHDLGGPAVFLAETAEEGGVCSRLSNVLTSPGDLRLVFAHDSIGYDPRTMLTVGECELVETAAGLMLRRRDGTFERGLLEVLGDLLAAVLAQSFHPVAPAAHAPRVTIDDLVLSRESWTMPAAEPPFADTAGESVRYAQARRWAAGHGLPRHVFARFTGEGKPIYADLTSLASVDLMARALRRSRREAGPDATVTVVEMLPTPEQAWLTDAQGRRYTAELRTVAVDQVRIG